MYLQKNIAELQGTFLLNFADIASLANNFPLATPLVAGLTLGLVVYTMGGVSRCAY